MIEIKNYMNDGAGWQAKAVLAYIQGNIHTLTEDKYYGNNVDVLVGRYENCREQGYVINIRFFGESPEEEPGHFKKRTFQRNYAVYQHRNSDNICVLISDVFTLNTPSIDEMWHDKGENPRSSQYDQGFDWDDIKGCGEFILEDMDAYLDKYLIKTHPEDK